jgi:hypothetical protein
MFFKESLAQKLKNPGKNPEFSSFAEGERFETYSFSTRSGYFCSSYDSKTISEQLRISCAETKKSGKESRIF